MCVILRFEWKSIEFVYLLIFYILLGEKAKHSWVISSTQCRTEQSYKSRHVFGHYRFFRLQWLHDSCSYESVFHLWLPLVLYFFRSLQLTSKGMCWQKENEHHLFIYTPSSRQTFLNVKRASTRTPPKLVAAKVSFLKWIS